MMSDVSSKRADYSGAGMPSLQPGDYIKVQTTFSYAPRRSPQKISRALPAERFMDANRSGLRYAKNNPPLRATLISAVAFFLFASAYWALLPLVARNQIGGGAELYGLLLGGIGVGALVGAYLLPRLAHRPGGGIGPQKNFSGEARVC